MKIPYKAIHLEDAEIFSLEGIHKKYWKDFCDMCHTRIGFSPNRGVTRCQARCYVMILSPNYHRIVHKANPHFNRKTLSFEFSNGLIEKVKLNRHL